ncbi:protein PHLOEM PROTEIN 2-LIKE A9 isoform X2 [Quercus suber]|uniref:protein PHLOEM PROTEIN 2-LIKE A9 isoform X2 n=1 Tax=Quercus suber TaxID=58331 RepID=UPI0032DF2A95
MHVSFLLNIIWGHDNQYWHLPTDNNGSPAELIQVSWLEVTGTFDGVKGKKYEIGFEVSLTPDAFGWNGCHVYVMAKVGKRGKYSWKRSSLENPKTGNFQIPLETLDIKVDDNANNTDNKIYFGMYEVWSGKWKGGLKIYNAIIKEVPATPSATPPAT